MVAPREQLNEQELLVRQWHRAMAPRYVNPSLLASENGALYQAWHDVDFLLKRLDALQEEYRRATETDLPALPAITPATVVAALRPRVDPADFTETISLEPPRAPALPPPPAQPPEPQVTALGVRVGLLNEAELWNAAVVAITIRVEEALAQSAMRKLDLHATKAVVLKAVAGCRRPL